MFAWTMRGTVRDDAQVRRHLERWIENFGESPGYCAAVGGTTDDRRFVLVVLWESEDAGNELLRRSEPHDWYAEFIDLLEHGIEFVESADVTARLSDDVVDASVTVVRRRAAGEPAETHGEFSCDPSSPDVLGCVEVWTATDTVVSVIFHRSERCDPAALGFGGQPEVLDDSVERCVMSHPFVHVSPGRTVLANPDAQSHGDDDRSVVPR